MPPGGIQNQHASSGQGSFIVVQMGVEPTKSPPSQDGRFTEGLRTVPFFYTGSSPGCLFIRSFMIALNTRRSDLAADR